MKINLMSLQTGKSNGSHYGIISLTLKFKPRSYLVKLRRIMKSRFPTFGCRVIPTYRITSPSPLGVSLYSYNWSYCQLSYR